MNPRTKPAPPSAADARPIKVNRPKLATDPGTLGLDIAARVAAAHTTIDDRVVALGLDLAPLAGYGFALVEPGGPFDPKLDFTALGQLDLQGGDWDSGPAVFVRLRSFLEVIRPAAIFFRETPVPPAAPGGRAGAVAVTAGRKADGAIRVALKRTLTDWAERCRVPCIGFEVGALKKKFLGRGVAGKADLIHACTERFGVALDPDGCDLTGVDRVAVAALGLLAGLEERRVKPSAKHGR